MRVTIEIPSWVCWAFVPILWAWAVASTLETYWTFRLRREQKRANARVARAYADITESQGGAS